MSEDVTETDDTQTTSSPPTTTPIVTPSVAMPTGMVFTLGIGLITVNALADGKAAKAWDAIWNGNLDLSKNVLIELSGEFLFVLVAAFIASSNPEASNLLFALFVGLWLVWSMTHTATIEKWRVQFIQSSGQKA